MAMTVASSEHHSGRLGLVVREMTAEGEGFAVAFRWRVGRIHSDLTVGPDMQSAERLLANGDLSFMGVTLVGEGFRLRESDLVALGFAPNDLPPVIRPHANGREISRGGEPMFVVDFFGLGEQECRDRYPSLYQWLADRVRPERQHNKRQSYREKWWIFGEPRSRMRRALAGLRRFAVTLEASKHRFFVFFPTEFLLDHSLFAVALDDFLHLGVLSSRLHVLWSLAAGSRLGVENDPRWRNNACFEPFPFPACSEDHKARIRALGEQLDAHRKRQQAEHPDLTITGMYNVLEKLRSGEAFTAKEKKIHDQGLVSVLEQIHDDLDAAVFDAYGWPHDLSDEQIPERLVALNAERAAEEKRGLVRWLRPEFQNRGGAGGEAQAELAGTQPAAAAAVAAKLPKWPAKLADQIAAVRGLAATGQASWSVEEVARQFKGARPGSVAEVLEGLAALGFLVAYDADGVRRWKAPGRAAA